MKKTIYILLSLGFLGLSTAYGQVKVGDNPTTIHSSAALEVESSNKGFLPPRMTTAERDAIPSPPAGLLIYNNTTKSLEVSDGTNWIKISDGLASGAIGSGTVPTATGIGIGTATPDGNAIIDIVSTTQGFLPPRMDIIQRDGIATPVEGLTIYNTDNNCLEFFNVTDWISACPSPLPGALGSTFTSYSNGTENFSDNTTCQNKLISAHHDLTTCSGNVVVGSNTYPVVLINGQCWMQTNLKEVPTNYNPVPNWVNNSDVGWSGVYSPVPPTDEGLLYQWSAAMNGSTTERAQGVCPTGWHIPSDCEWMYLEHGLGMSISDQNITSSSTRNSGSVGGKLSTLTRDQPSSSNGSGTNSSGFTALLAGNRASSGMFTNRGSIGIFWSSSETNATNAHRRNLRSYEAGVQRLSTDKAGGYAVRCIKD